ncbi:MAG: response regulator, partial [Gammaproteobacteria bacterium]|nr:response regulator [Gammaproteobacteria bacterium]
LVVDDNKTNLKIIKEQLSSANINSTIIETGKKALALLDEPDKIKYDAIILDYCMPVMDGAELGKSILNNPATKTIPLILLTSAGQRGDVKHFEKLGFAGYLNKPALKDTLLAVISAVVSGSQQETRQEIITSHTVLDISTSNHDADFSTAQLSNAKILLAEDDLVNQQLATKLLNKINIQPDIAVNGIEVLEKTKTKDYDLILMDGQMPEMDGYEATRQLRKIPKTETIPIVALTANAQKSDRDYCIECGMDDFLAKPFSFNDFIKLLNRWLPESSFSENIESEVNAVVQNNKVSSSPVMNFDTFEKLRSTLPEVFENIVKTFLDESQQRVNEIIQSIADDEIEEATMPAHRLKSGSASLGATALAHTAALLESSSKQNDKETSTILSKDLEEIFLATQQAIEAHMTNN